MVTYQQIESASVRIRPIAHRTPVMTSTLFRAECGIETYFKCENFQKGGAFKIRGAANFLFSLTPEQLAPGVVAFSSGNHAQAVALAARHVGVPATIVMPGDAPASKLAATRAYGARVIEYDRFSEDREAIGRSVADETGAALVPPYDHEWIIAGQGTAALELLEECPPVDALVTCIGGGGLMAGSCIAARGMRPGIRLFGAEPEMGNDTYLSLRAGTRVEIPMPETIADGLRVQQPGALTFPVIQSMVEDIVLITEDEIREAMAFLESRLKIVVEPSGAVPAAAVLFRKLPNDVRSAAVILSGGNR